MKVDMKTPRKDPLLGLSRRERQIMDILYREGRAAATDVMALLPDPPGYSAVRALLRALENKGHARHVLEGTRYVYLPTVPADRARRSALRRAVGTLFSGPPRKAGGAPPPTPETGPSARGV